jgi:hypothetical protein
MQDHLSDPVSFGMFLYYAASGGCLQPLPMKVNNSHSYFLISISLEEKKKLAYHVRDNMEPMIDNGIEKSIVW